MKRGSALLVVLGMLAFMVISGIAFSVFMRATRMPSSFTRRTVATRQLAKAALAEAIDQIDRAVANDPHPNVRLNGANEYNCWLGRVLLTTDTTSGTQKKPLTVWSELNSNPNDGGCDMTVPVLSLEALAYLPPPLVNEARFYGQKTASASWQTFDFDSGRYAFIALDVSDYFDVNRVLADEGRSSNPARRVTISHLFEGGGEEHSSKPTGVDAWETFMDKFRTANDDGTFSFKEDPPLVSLADFNLALNSQTFGEMKSPFYQYVRNGGGGTGFYDATPDSSQWDAYARMTFVTDSLDAPIPEAERKTEAGETVLNLDDDGNQIFSEAFLAASQENRTLLGVNNQLKSGTGKLLVQNRVPYVTMFNLSDYLDGDRLPISLGIPSVERVPMICGIKPSIGTPKVKVSVVKNEDNNGADKEEAKSATVKHVTRTVAWRLDSSALAGSPVWTIGTLVAYPFRNHEQAGEGSHFKIDGKVQCFLSSETMRLRTGNADDLLHWAASGDANSGGSAELRNNAVMNLPLTAANISVPGTVSKADDCVIAQDLTADASKIASELAGAKGDILSVTYEWDKKLVDPDNNTWEPEYGLDKLPPATCITKASSALRPLKRDGTVDGAFSDNMTKIVASLDKTLQFNVAVTLRVTSSVKDVLGDGVSGTKTVDMVPATLFDDKPLNNVDNSMGLSAAVYTDQLTGQATPLMKFETGVSFPFKLDLGTSCDAEVKLTVGGGNEASIMVDDPRFNHAPENWKVLSDFSANGWVSATTASARDGDIFMASSDQAYLQSVYEFAFLPRFATLENTGSSIGGFLSGYPAAGDSSWEKLCQKDPVDANLMWKTYDIFGRYTTDGDDFEGLGLENLGKGLRVNPYSDSTNVIMAAFANTPHDWRAASENEVENQGAELSAGTFNVKYAWNAYSSGAKLAWEDLELVAREFMSAVGTRARSGGTWQDALVDIFDREQTKDTEEYLCGVKLESPSDKIYSVDKKFLYGYWRNCFAARQQLYLVFFRAEPMMLGGGVAGVTPPQLGAKGVAVVWRNPNLPKNANTGTLGYSSPGVINQSYIPHQTRILFYRQFE